MIEAAFILETRKGIMQYGYLKNFGFAFVLLLVKDNQLQTNNKVPYDVKRNKTVLNLETPHPETEVLKSKNHTFNHFLKIFSTK